MQVRYYQSSDAGQMARLYFDTVHTVNRRDYTDEQITAWAPVVPDETQWSKRYETRIAFVAVDNSVITGFAELEPVGHIDCFYCHHAYQRRGIGTLLLNRLEQEARTLGLKRLFTEASITAKPFFESKGFHALRENQILRNNVMLINFSMEKHLAAHP
jgi:N-acetylglutamate synthase-like GNAT family acetyltransferase